MPTQRTSRGIPYVGLILAVALGGCGSTSTIPHVRSGPSTTPTVQQEQREIVLQREQARARAAAARREREAREPGERWQALQHDLVGTLALSGGAEAYERLSEAREDRGAAYAASELREDIHALTITRSELASLARRSTRSCATAIEHARTLLGERQGAVEHTAADSQASEYAWANSQHELEPLELPPGHLGDGLQTCDPDGTGALESEGE